ncbi:MAG: hypothetical protein HFF18_09965 [Oscillospiraceae bacterium]|nr:hypothetical protein [Oscillospiraceae bacterium]
MAQWDKLDSHSREPALACMAGLAARQEGHAGHLRRVPRHWTAHGGLSSLFTVTEPISVANKQVDEI